MTKWIVTGIEYGIVLWFTIPNYADRQNESGFTIHELEESTQLKISQPLPILLDKVAHQVQTRSGPNIPAAEMGAIELGAFLV